MEVGLPAGAVEITGQSRQEPAGPGVPGIARAQASEDALIERAKHDRHAFAEVYRQHYRPIVGYVFRRVGDSHVADDLVADVFLIALRKLPGYRCRGLPFRSWLYRIATNRVNRWARGERRRLAQESRAARAVGTAQRPDSPLTSDEVRRALLQIAPKYQAVIALYHLEGLSTEKVAAVTGCRLGTVKSRLSRGRDALREHLQKRRTRL